MAKEYFDKLSRLVDELKIEEEMPEWLATLDRYDDPSIGDMGEVWGF